MKVCSFGIFTAVLIEIYVLSQSEKITHRLYSITHFQELEDFYVHVRDQNPQTESNLTPASKRIICSRIFYERFDHRSNELTKELSINPDQHIIELKHKYRRIFDDIYEQKKSFLSTWFGVYREEYEYINRSELRAIHIKKRAYMENVFICPVQDRELNCIKPYYVSDYDYNVNETSNGEYIVGRFVFSSSTENELVVDSLAEEYAFNAVVANLLNPNDIKSYYLRKRDSHTLEESAADDPICKLSHGVRLRLCNSIFMGEIITWNPLVEIIAEHGCERKKISFWDEYQSEYEFEEWMIVCRSKTKDLLDTTNFVSRGYKNNEVFVFKKYYSDAHLKLIFGKYKVSVVVENENTD